MFETGSVGLAESQVFLRLNTQHCSNNKLEFEEFIVLLRIELIKKNQSE